jgi:hypothetical protein
MIDPSREYAPQYVGKKALMTIAVIARPKSPATLIKWQLQASPS